MEICKIHDKSPNNQVVCFAIVDFHCKIFKGKFGCRQELLRGLLPFTFQTGLENPHLDLQGKVVLRDLLAGIGILCKRIT